MRATAVLDHRLLATIEETTVRSKVEGKDLLEAIGQLPDVWGELFYKVITDRWTSGHTPHELSPVLIAIYIFICGYNRTVPVIWQDAKNELDMRNDPEWEEYCRLSEKFSIRTWGNSNGEL